VNKGRLEAFSDGVMAIIITIMVLELRPPEEGSFASLVPLLPKFLSYILSFVFLGIYWNNHHHLWQVVERVNGRVLWANLHLLFWLSLIPFATGWMGESHFATIPVALYGAILWMCAIAYYIMVRALLVTHTADSVLASAISNASKERWSLYLYTASVPLAFVNPAISMLIYVVVAIIWLAPDPRIEARLAR
jgi:uncharacterized membrane protein